LARSARGRNGVADALNSRIALLRSDRESGASEIVDEVLAIYREALAAHVPLAPLARAICRAQPTMASLWNLAFEVLAPDQVPERLEAFARRLARGSEALVRAGTELFQDDPERPLRLVTISFSRSVATLVESIAARRDVRVSCSESRPALEGRRLASRLASAGIAVTCFSDAAIGHALGVADAAIVGADAVAPEWFLNKSGTRMLAAAAGQQGVPVYVVATRDKFVGHAVAARLRIREGKAAEVWESPPAGVAVRNPYFETTPLDLISSLITDVGVIGAAVAAEVCEAISRDQPPDLIDRL
jgi:translation initiation factor 2B subunit (eIF-2B alpha/beta/delta family)